MNPILEKIRKCLAMAEHERSNPTEAATALRMAQALMRQHGISEAHLAAAAIKEKQVLAARKTRTPWETAISALVCKTFGVRCYWSNSSEFMDEWGARNYYGPEHRVEIAAYAHDVVMRLLDRARKDWVKANPKQGREASDSFVLGFIDEVESKLAPLIPSESEKTAIMAYRASKGLSAAPNQRLSCGSSSGYAAGREAGSGVSLHAGMRSGAPLKAIR